MATAETKKKTAKKKPASDQTTAQDLADQQQSDDHAAQTMMARLEEMENRLKEREKRLDKRESELEADRQAQDETMAKRLAALESAAVPGSAAAIPRSRGGSGVTIRVNKGDFIAYDTRLGKGTHIQGGWVKCTRDQEVSEAVTMVAIARGSFQYDKAYGLPYHQALAKDIGIQPYKKFWADPERPQVVGPPFLQEVEQQVSQPQFGLATA